MFELEQLVSPAILSHMADTECLYLSDVFSRCNGYPTLQQLWNLMDESWEELGCNSVQIDERITAFYNHPVWLLNGLFIEQDSQSLANRHQFTDWVKQKCPKRIADYGGGFGCLARMIGTALPDTQVEVVEPHPHPAAIALASTTPNVRFVSDLSRSYDLIIATDVFEHVPDPIGLVYETAHHLHIGGLYLMANCFSPVIKCHLPQLNHLEFGWDLAMKALGLEPVERVQYGVAYQRLGELFAELARLKELHSRKIYPWVCRLPRGRSRVGQIAMHLLAALSGT